MPLKKLGPWYIEGDKLIFGKPSEQSLNSVVSDIPIEKCAEKAKEYISYGDYAAAIELYRKACSVKNHANYYEFALFCLENHDNIEVCEKNIPYSHIYQAAFDGYQPMIDLLKRYPLVFGWDKTNGLRYYSDLIINKNHWFLCNQAAYFCFNSEYFNDKAKGWELVQIGVEHNDLGSLSFLAEMYDPNYYIEGGKDFIKKDKKKALELYQKAIKLGDKNSFYDCGILLLEDENNKGNYQLGISYLEKEGESGNVWAMKRLMEEFYYSEAENDDKALYWAQKIINHQPSNPREELGVSACNKRAMGIIGTIYYGQDKETEAFYYLESAHDYSSGERTSYYSTVLLAECYFYGYGTSIDYSYALKYYSICAEEGTNYLANSNLIYVYNKLGYMYENGLGVSQNSSKSISYYMKAANHDDPRAAARVADAYFDGDGIEQDLNRAIFWFEKSAQQGYAYSWYSLGWIYAREKYGRYNATKAVEYFNKAIECDKDAVYSASCYYELGMIYEYGGGGISKSYSKAGAYYKKAAELGHDKAKEKMKEFE